MLRWKDSKNIQITTEDVLLTFFREHFVVYRHTTLMSYVGRLRACLFEYENINMNEFESISRLLEAHQIADSKKAILTLEEVQTFVEEAPDEQYLVSKVTNYLST